jgi:hypothetical protein
MTAWGKVSLGTGAPGAATLSGQFRSRLRFPPETVVPKCATLNWAARHGLPAAALGNVVAVTLPP